MYNQTAALDAEKKRAPVSSMLGDETIIFVVPKILEL
jgi:hypothetical protein